MKTRIRLCMAAILMLSALVPAIAFGAASSVSMSGDGSADVGKVMTITVTYRGDSLGYVNGQLTYDNNKLQYLSGGSSQGDAGLVELKSYANDASGKLSFRVKFKAVGSGSTGLSLETLETQNLDGDQDMGQPSASKTVKIESSPTTEPTEETTTEETTLETTTAPAATAAPTETTSPDQDQPPEAEQEQEQGSSIHYPLVIGIAVVILLIIAVIIVALRKKKS